MEKNTDEFDNEINHISRAIQASEYFEKEDKTSLDCKTLYDLYNAVTDGLISSEILIKNGPPGFVEHANKVKSLLEQKLFSISLIAITKDPEFKDRNCFKDSPWINKFKEKNYFESFFKEYPRNTTEKLYSFLFG